MNVDTAIDWIDQLLVAETGKHLNDLQIFIIRCVWLGRKYVDIAADYHCTEGHVKDIAAALWQLLSQLLEERVTKTNLQSILQRHATSAAHPKKITNYQFIGRAGSIAILDDLIQQGQRAITILGEGGIGKTTLAQQYLKTCGCDLILELSMAKETAQITPAEMVVEEWLCQDLQIEPGREFGVSLLRLKRQLITRKIGVLIDNFEPALDGNGQIVPSQRSYVELLRVLTDRQLLGITLITSRDRLGEIDLNLTHYRLPGLDLDTWHTYFNHRQIDAEVMMIMPLHRRYGGNAKAMEIMAGNICTDFDRDLELYLSRVKDYQSVETGLKQLISNQFDRLQLLDPAAYQLLCRAGCYRYQELDRIHLDALFYVLWDIEPKQRLHVVNSLRNRSLIEFHCGQYWLHPAIKAESNERLRQTDDWIKTHQQAAQYWTNSVSKTTDISTAITALEAFYHYLEIDDISHAVRILLQPRDNQWGQFLPLASNLYRMGAVQLVLTAITQILVDLPPDRSTAELHNILGDLYWIVGRVHEAIETQQYAIDYTDDLLAELDELDQSHDTHCLKILKIDSFLSLGLYHIDLGKLVAAEELFEKIIEITKSTTYNRWSQKATICLALVKSNLHKTDRARQLLIEIEPLIVQQQWTGSSAYFMQMVGQTYINLGEYDRAQTIFQQTLTFCQTGNYLQTQGKTLTGLAQLARLQNDIETAQSNHLQAIEILDRLGAKCDLAQAYYQAGLTWQQAGDLQQSQIYGELYARKLFAEIAAPQQSIEIKARISK